MFALKQTKRNGLIVDHLNTDRYKSNIFFCGLFILPSAIWDSMC